mgnify:CR=1 FL=1
MIKYKELTTEELILKLIWRLNLVTEKGYTKPQRNEIEKMEKDLVILYLDLKQHIAVQFLQDTGKTEARF